MHTRRYLWIVAGLAIGSLWAAPRAAADGIQNGDSVAIDYTLTVDGKVEDSSQGRGPLTYVQGSSQIIPGLEKQLAGLKVGDERDRKSTRLNSSH